MIDFEFAITNHNDKAICYETFHIDKKQQRRTTLGKTEKYDHMKLIGKYAGGYKHLITTGRFLAGVSGALTLIPYYLIWKIIRCAVNGEELNKVSLYAWTSVGVIIGALLIYIAALFCTHVAAFHVQTNMRSALMHRIITLPLGIFDEDGTGKIRRIVYDSTEATETYIAHNLADKAVAAVTPVGLLVLLFAFNWKIGLLCLIPTALGFACLSSMMGSSMQQKMKEYQDALGKMSSEATEYVRGVPVVKTFGQTVYSFKRFKACIDGYKKWVTEYTLMLRIPMCGFMTCVNAVFAFIVIAAYMVSKNGIENADILNIMYYIIITPLVTIALTKLAYSGEAEMTLIDALKRADTILAIEPLTEGKGTVVPADHSITLKNVSYRYKDAGKDAVENVSLSIKPGEHVALVGPSGSGKTTLAQLMVRFFDVTDGAILLGGVNVKDIPQKKLMEQVSFVFQDSRLIKKSILENVRMGRPDATEEEVLNALKKAQCMDIIDKLPKGIHTVIGEKGTYLSGGEQQRITIARAVLKDAPILILDEATAFADPDNEAKVQAAFEELSKDKTLIMIAHRLSTVMNADRIFVLDNGRCIESGTHDEFMAENGLYQRMFEEYTRSIQWKVGA